MALLPSPAGQPNLHGNGGATPPTRRRITIDPSHRTSSHAHPRPPAAGARPWRKPTSAKWLENLEQLAVFVGEQGHPDVPLDHPLGKWLASTELPIAEVLLMLVEWPSFGPQAFGPPHGGALGRRPCVVDGICQAGGPRRRAPGTPRAGRAASRVVEATKTEALEGLMAPNRIKMLEELGVTGLTVKSREKRGHVGAEF